VPTPTLFELALCYGALSLPWVPRRRRRAVAAVLVVLGGADIGSWARERFFRRDLLVRFLDVGQGDAAVVELPGGAVVVVDGGGFPRSRFDVGERVVARYLWTRKVLRLEAIAATHADFDHQGGLHALAREFSPRELWRSRLAAAAEGLEPLERIVRERGGRVRALSAGEEVWRSGGVAIHCLHPPPEGRLSDNDSSLVLRIAAGEVSLLLAGDVEREAEERIPAPAAEVLKVPHHGSRTSSTSGFLSRVRPRVAVFSVGSGNRYGLPHPEVLARYRALGVRILRTDLDGSILVRARDSAFQVRPFSRASPFVCPAFGLLC
jgi:competence protein ComEC